jgi:hypothetical protein
MFIAHFLPTATDEACQLDFTGPLAEVVTQVLTVWWEDAGNAGCTLVDDTGRPVATLARTDTDGERSGTVAVVDFTDGTFTRYSVRYVLDAEGTYDRTEIMPAA